MGRKTRLERVLESDAEYIFGLRTNEDKSRFLNATSGTVADQATYIRKALEDDNQGYYKIIVEDERRVGVVRIYDIVGDSFSWGSWIIQDDRPKYTALESAFLVYATGFDYSNFPKCHYEVRRENTKVCAFHERLGAVRTSETEQDIFYNFPKSAWDSIQNKYPGFIPQDGWKFEKY